MPRPFIPPAEWHSQAFRQKCEAEFEKAAEALRNTLPRLSDENRTALSGYLWDGKPAYDETGYGFCFRHRDPSRENVIVYEDGSLLRINSRVPAEVSDGVL